MMRFLAQPRKKGTLRESRADNGGSAGNGCAGGSEDLGPCKRKMKGEWQWQGIGEYPAGPDITSSKTKPRNPAGAHH